MNHYTIQRRRKGLSLFEVLAAVFVLMVGLLGVLAVLPFGIYQMSRVNKADYGGNCGRAALQEVKTRKLAYNYNTSFYSRYSTPQIYNSNNQQFYCAKPIIVDPLMLETNEFAANFNYFPYGNSNGLPRISCQLPPLPSNVTRLGLTQEIFYWGDEKNFLPPMDPVVNNPRPVAIFDDSRGVNAIHSKDNYSWLYMVTPNIRGIYSNFVNENDISGFEIDVVVFFDRALDVESVKELERRVVATPFNIGPGYRGGGVTIEADDPGDLDLADTRWVLLMCQQSNRPDFAKWYRIVSSDEEPVLEDGMYVRNLMLIGPDIPESAEVDDDGNKKYYAVLAKGVTHVYSDSVVK